MNHHEARRREVAAYEAMLVASTHEEYAARYDAWVRALGAWLLSRGCV